MTRADGWTAESSQKRLMLFIGWRIVRGEGTETAAATAVTCSGSLTTISRATGCPRSLASRSTSPETVSLGTRGGRP